MGKHRHSKDKLYITPTEYKRDWGGKKDPSLKPIPRLSFNYCPLGFQPCGQPVCTPQGIIYDLMYKI